MPWACQVKGVLSDPIYKVIYKLFICWLCMYESLASGLTAITLKKSQAYDPIIISRGQMDSQVETEVEH